jgi:pyruvate/2-oxoglutarate dehydrogenase complex dihydrolipoamide acyltransferase (E2) component
MDPIKTAVRYALIPLRVAVQLGDLYVGQDDEPRSQPQRQAPPEPAPRASAPTPPAAAKRKPTPRRKPQATRAAKAIGDSGIARKVETVIFRDPEVPKGDIDVNVVEGVVWLRGEAPHPEMITALEQQAVAIPEVVRVENLLHLPKTPAPTRADIFEREQKTRETKPRSSIVEDRPVQTRVTAERKDQPGEPLPKELARKGKGRQPAPLGAANGAEKPS